MLVITTSHAHDNQPTVSFIVPADWPRERLCHACLAIEERLGDQPYVYEIVAVDANDAGPSGTIWERSRRDALTYRVVRCAGTTDRQRALLGGLVHVRGRVVVLLDELPHDFLSRLDALARSLDTHSGASAMVTAA